VIGKVNALALVWVAAFGSAQANQAFSERLVKLAGARSHFDNAFKRNIRFMAVEEAASSLENHYPLRQLFPVGRADVRFIFGFSNYSGKWILARQSFKGTRSSTDWCVDLVKSTSGKKGKLGALGGLLQSRGVALPPSAPGEARGAAKLLKSFTVYWMDPVGKHINVWSLSPSGDMGQSERFRFQHGDNVWYPIPRGEQTFLKSAKVN
jgi:hypothetical protein